MVAKHLKALCHLPIICDEKNVTVIIDAVTEAIESLNSLCVNDCWQLMLCHLVTSKLDDKNRKQWKLATVSKVDHPIYDRLEKFFHERAKAFEALFTSKKCSILTPSKTLTKSDKHSSATKKVIVTGTAEQFKCLECAIGWISYRRVPAIPKQKFGEEKPNSSIKAVVLQLPEARSLCHRMLL